MGSFPELPGAPSSLSFGVAPVGLEEAGGSGGKSGQRLGGEAFKDCPVRVYGAPLAAPPPPATIPMGPFP